MTAQDMQCHVAQLCAAHQIRAKELTNGPRAALARGRSIFIERPDTPVRYFVALHEIGHVVAPAGHRGRRIDREVAAWNWVLEEARCPLTPAVRRHIAEGLRSHVSAAANRRLLGKAALPAPDDAVWCLLEAMDPGFVGLNADG